jgi:hypothetical protein
MKRFEQNQRINIRFGGPTRFTVPPKPAAPFRGAREAELESLKERLLQEALEQTVHPEFNAPLRRAANEAAALAWATCYPLLVFPTLFEEKTESAARQADRQAEIREQSLAWLEAG